MEFKEHFIDSLGYEIELSSRVCHETFKRWFEKNVKSVTLEEFTILDTLDCNQNLSQIELANAILKGKAHTGKFLDSLEEKELITRLYDTKKSRMVKIPVMTELGKKTYDEIRIKTQEVFEKVHKMFPKAEIDRIRDSLRKYRKTVTEMANISFKINDSLNNDVPINDTADTNNIQIGTTIFLFDTLDLVNVS